jgi:hypothetical protein
MQTTHFSASDPPLPRPVKRSSTDKVHRTIAADDTARQSSFTRRMTNSQQCLHAAIRIEGKPPTPTLARQHKVGNWDRSSRSPGRASSARPAELDETRRWRPRRQLMQQLTTGRDWDVFSSRYYGETFNLNSDGPAKLLTSACVGAAETLRLRRAPAIYLIRRIK